MTRAIGIPEPGFFQMRQVKGGVFVSAVIYRPCPLEIHNDAPWQWIDRWPHLKAEIDGQSADVGRVWTSGRRIPIAEYLFLKDDRAWARQYAPHLPEANPRQPVDFNTLAPPQF